MPFIADLHIHSPYSRATSKDLNFEILEKWGRIKGISLIGTGDFTHPAWLNEIKTKLADQGNGLFRLKKRPPSGEDIHFMITGEISNIYKYGDKTRKVHNLICMPDIDSTERFAKRLDRIGNIRSDGRPILGLDARDLLEIMLETSDAAVLIPAHIWTPWFSVLGSKSGFDSIEACYRDLSKHIFALETGLSSDPPMNWTVPSLDRYTLVSNSDAHSAAKLGREANVFNCRMDYQDIMDSLRRKKKGGFWGTLEFFPEEGKYHYDGHRKCSVLLSPDETLNLKGICPVCSGKLTVGVSYRVAELGKRKMGYKPKQAFSYENILALQEILGELMGVGSASKKVKQEYDRLIAQLGPELEIIRNVALDEIKVKGSEILAEAVKRVRAGKIHATPGFDGEFGIIRVFDEKELKEFIGQTSMFAQEPAKQIKRKARGQKKKKEKKAKKKGQTRPESENPDQEKAVRAGNAPVIVVAGPGTGKTRTLARRIDYLVSEQSIPPENILAITFSNRAAREMTERIQKRLPAGDKKRFPFIGTFHQLGLKLISENLKALGFSHVPEILDEDEAKRLEKEKGSDYARYKAANHLVDYDDLLVLPQNMLKADPQLLLDCQKRWPHVFVDEYQDINEHQYALLRQLCPPESMPFVIGDPDQAIYGFRGGDVGYFIKFQEDYTRAVKVTLKQAYRSTDTILRASAQMIEKSSLSPETDVWSGIAGKAHIDIHGLPTEKAEAEHILKTIEELVGGSSYFAVDSGRGGYGEYEDIGFGDIVVLYRTHAVGDAVEAALSRSGIPLQRALRKDKKERLKGGLQTVLDIEEKGDFYEPRLQRVALMTLHAAKGLEWKVVFIAGCEDGLLPYTEWDRKPDINEERRLLYVGMTRAMQHLFITHAETRMFLGKRKKREPSPFLEEIEENLKRLDKPFKGQRRRKKETAEQISLF
jgi:uncharacterized protein (TIGR00375 family)